MDFNTSWYATSRFRDYGFWALASILLAYPFGALVGATESPATVLVQGVVAATMIFIPSLVLWGVIRGILRKNFSWTLPTLLTIAHVFFMSLSNIAINLSN